MATIDLLEGTRAFLAHLFLNPMATPLPLPTINLLFDLANDQISLSHQVHEARAVGHLQDVVQLTARLKRSMQMTECLRTFVFDQARDAIEEEDTRFGIIVAQRYATTPDPSWTDLTHDVDGMIPAIDELSEEDSHVLQWYGRDTDDDQAAPNMQSHAKSSSTRESTPYAQEPEESDEEESHTPPPGEATPEVQELGESEQEKSPTPPDSMTHLPHRLPVIKRCPRKTRR
jgi:hypothetical protein